MHFCTDESRQLYFYIVLLHCLSYLALDNLELDRTAESAFLEFRCLAHRHTICILYFHEPAEERTVLGGRTEERRLQEEQDEGVLQQPFHSEFSCLLQGVLKTHNKKHIQWCETQSMRLLSINQSLVAPSEA